MGKLVPKNLQIIMTNNYAQREKLREWERMCTSRASISSKDGFLSGASSLISMSNDFVNGCFGKEPNDSRPRIMRTALTICAMVFDCKN